MVNNAEVTRAALGKRQRLESTFYDISATRNYHPAFNTNGFPYTNPTDVFAPNTYGLQGMADNICEWCWDWFDPGCYGTTAATNNNCHGPWATA